MRGVNRVTARGRTYYYHRKTGERLPDEPEARRVRMLEIARGSPVKKTRLAAGSIADLITRYRQSPHFKKLADSTKREYGRYIAALEADFGAHAVNLITREFVIELRDDMGDTPRAADCMVKLLRLLLNYALDKPSQYGVLFNPCLGVKPIANATPYRAWPDGLVSAFRVAAYSELRLAMEIGQYTGQRISDCAAMLWSQYDGRAITLRQKKTGERLTVPAHGELREILTGVPRTQAVILTSKNGRPWHVDHLRHEIREACAALGWAGYSFHGLRKRAGKMLAEAGCTEREIMAVLGHRSSAMVLLYTREAEQHRLAGSAVTKLERHSAAVLQLGKNGSQKT